MRGQTKVGVRPWTGLFTTNRKISMADSFCQLHQFSGMRPWACGLAVAPAAFLPGHKLIYTSGYEQSDATQREAYQRPRLSRKLCQQCADAREHLGLLSGFRHAAATDREPCGDQELPGDLSEPAAGQSAARTSGAECGGLRERVRRDQARPSHGGARARALNLGLRHSEWS